LAFSARIARLYMLVLGGSTITDRVCPEANPCSVFLFDPDDTHEPEPQAGTEKNTKNNKKKKRK
jgi:hypothetical protein